MGKRRDNNNSRRSRYMSGETLERRVLLAGSAAAPVLYPLGDLIGARLAAKVAGPLADTLYDAVGSIGRAANGAAAAVAAKSMAPFKLELAAIRQTLNSAPREFTRDADANALVLPLPMPDGTFSRFKVFEAPVMEAALAAKFPEIKTFRGVGLDDPTAQLRMDYSPLGFHAQVLSVNGSYYIDPYYQNDAEGIYASYFKRDLQKQFAWECEKDQGELDAETEAVLDRLMGDSLSLEAAALAPNYGSDLRTYRAAVAATGEYTAAVGSSTVAGGQAAVVTAMNRVTGVYESELSIRMVLVGNNSSLIYTNANTDPYTNNNASSLLTQNQSNIDSVIGTANYDIGHVFSTGGGGLASLGVVGRSGVKARGETGLPNPTGDVFYIDYVAHEMGHQFGANHTFNGTQSNLSGNRNANTAYEPGSGSTIMAYAGIGGTDNLQSNSDAFFHSASIDEIRNYVTGTIPAVGTLTSTGNAAPSVSGPGNFIIPTGTPFVLTATGSDPNGDPITYDWQERDLGAAISLSTADNGTSPLFRAYAPTTSPARYLPKLSTILAGQNNTLAPSGGSNAVERLATVARSAFKWRVIARDNRAGGGGVSSADVTLTVVNTGASFAVTAPDTAVSWNSASSQTVTWNVAGTTANGINTASVNILLSTDGGNTFPVNLTPGGTSNDGSQAVTLPGNIGSTTARIKVEAVGNIFFDISNASFTIVNVGGGQTAAPGQPVLAAGSDKGVSNSDGITNLNNSNAANRLTFEVPNTVNGAAVTLLSGTTEIGTGTGNGGTLSIVTNGTAILADGTVSITARQAASGQTQSNASPARTITIDTARPTAPAVFRSGATQDLTFVFSEDLAPSMTASGAATLDLKTLAGAAVSSGSMAVNYTPGTRTAVYTFPGLANQKLADGAYSAASVATDVAGNTPSSAPLIFIYGGGTAAHTFYLRTSTSHANVEVYKNTAPDGSPDIVAPWGAPAQVVFDGSGFNDAVTIDYTLGNPLPAGAGGFAFNGGAGNDTLNLTGNATFTFYSDASSTSSNLTVNSNATDLLFNTSQHLAGLGLTNGADAQLITGAAKVLVTGALSMNASSLNLNANRMIVRSGSAEAIDDMISSGALFTGVANDKTTLGVSPAGEALYLDAGETGEFAGETVSASNVLVKYTYFGDANLDGVIDADDYSAIDTNWRRTGEKRFWHGDFNHDGVTDADDYSLIDVARSQPLPPL